MHSYQVGPGLKTILKTFDMVNSTKHEIYPAHQIFTYAFHEKGAGCPFCKSNPDIRDTNIIQDFEESTKIS